MRNLQREDDPVPRIKYQYAPFVGLEQMARQLYLLCVDLNERKTRGNQSGQRQLLFRRSQAHGNEACLYLNFGADLTGIVIGGLSH